MSAGMSCDLASGTCGEGAAGEAETLTLAAPAASLDLYYVTDPICSHCWALEPVLGRLLSEYGSHVRLHTVMGGLLERWDGFGDPGNGISGPADVAAHWREVGEHSRMPIDGSLWLRDPVRSSYPASRVFVVLRERDERLARRFLRRVREAVFVLDRNVGADGTLAEIVDGLGLHGAAVVAEANGATGHALLERDLALVRRMGVRGFPTIVLGDAHGRGVKIAGARALATYVAALGDLLGEAGPPERSAPPPLAALLEPGARIFARELEVMYDLAPGDVDAFVEAELPRGTYRLARLLGERCVEGLEPPG